MDYKKTIKERIKILPEELRDFVLDESWRGNARKISEEFSLGEEKYASFENEIFLTLLCFEPRKNFAENIKNELELDSNTIGWITEDVEKEIFSQVSGELDAIENQVEENENQAEPIQNKQNNVGQSFEQIILNQTKAMMPARPAGEVPNNLPTAKPATQTEQAKVPDYSGSDPYREPIE